MIKAMNFLYKLRGTLSSTSSQKMPKPALISKKSGSLWFEHSDYMNDLAESDDPNETVDPIWIFGYMFHETTDKDIEDNVILLERIVPEEDEDDSSGKKVYQQRLTPLTTATINLFHNFARCTLWFSYRNDFVAIQGPKRLRSDAGWGCMIRTAQMMIAEALIRNKMADSWKLSANPLDTPEIRVEIQKIISLFGDNESCPLSLHNIVYTGSKKYGKKPGEWFGPATVSNTFRDIILANDEEIGVTAYTAENGLIDVRQILRLLRDKQLKRESLANSADDESQFFRLGDDTTPTETSAKSKPKPRQIRVEDIEWSPLIILIPIKAGMETIHPTYIPSLESIFMIPQNIGVIGGKPYSSFYFIAGQGEVLHFLDPHYVQEYVPIPPDKVSYEIRTWTNPQVRWIKAANIDATFSAGFFIRDKADFIKFETISKYIFTKVPPLFSFEHGLVNKESLLSCSSSSPHSSAPSHETTTALRETTNTNAKPKETKQIYTKEAKEDKDIKHHEEKKELSDLSFSSSSSTKIEIGQPVPQPPQNTTESSSSSAGITIDDDDDDSDFEIIK